MKFTGVYEYLAPQALDRCVGRRIAAAHPIPLILGWNILKWSYFVVAHRLGATSVRGPRSGCWLCGDGGCGDCKEHVDLCLAPLHRPEGILVLPGRYIETWPRIKSFTLCQGSSEYNTK